MTFLWARGQSGQSAWLLAAVCGVGKSSWVEWRVARGQAEVWRYERVCAPADCEVTLQRRGSPVLRCAVRLRHWAWMKGLFFSGSQFDLLFGPHNALLHCRQPSALPLTVSHTWEQKNFVFCPSFDNNISVRLPVGAHLNKWQVQALKNTPYQCFHKCK